MHIARRLGHCLSSTQALGPTAVLGRSNNGEDMWEEGCKECSNWKTGEKRASERLNTVGTISFRSRYRQHQQHSRVGNNPRMPKDWGATPCIFSTPFFPCGFSEMLPHTSWLFISTPSRATISKNVAPRESVYQKVKCIGGWLPPLDLNSYKR